MEAAYCFIQQQQHFYFCFSIVTQPEYRLMTWELLTEVKCPLVQKYDGREPEIQDSKDHSRVEEFP